MPELLEIQRDFATSLRDAGAPPHAQRWLAGDSALVGQRLGIYRANAAASTAKALAAAYPVVGQVVGGEFFEGLARAYHHVTPSISGDLFDHGSGFGDFLAEFPHAQSLPCLPDLARLEWLVHRAYGARDAVPFDRAALISVPPEQQGAIRFDWAAGTAVMASAFPLARIWTIHQPGCEGEFAVDWSISERVLVARENLRVTVCALSAGDAAFIASALAGADLGDAAITALEADAGFDLGTVLARVLASNLICGLAVDKRE